MARPLVIDGKGIAELKAYANENRIPLDKMKRIANGDYPPAGDYKARTIMLPVGYRVVYTIEEHPDRDGDGTKWLRHLSITCDNQPPSKHAARLLMDSFDFGPTDDCCIYFEEMPFMKALNVIEVL
jgi:hypothetical protein